jgi:putative tricarboxylic transport membrane protein
MRMAEPDAPPRGQRKRQLAVAAGVLLLGGLLAAGALGIRSEAGYGGVGPNFLPWVVAVGLLLCGGLLVQHAWHGGFRALEAPTGDEQGHWWGFAWVSAGILLNAALITRVGFVLSCALCFVLAARGFRAAQAQPTVAGAPAWRAWVLDALLGLAISAPVFWMFSKALSIQLPGLTDTGWL